MDPNAQTTTQDMKCGNCGLVTLADGRQVWVCEHCGTENVPEAVTQPAAPVIPSGLDMTPPAAPAEPVIPQPTPVNPTQVVQ